MYCKIFVTESTMISFRHKLRRKNVYNLVNSRPSMMKCNSLLLYLYFIITWVLCDSDLVSAQVCKDNSECKIYCFTQPCPKSMCLNNECTSIETCRFGSDCPTINCITAPCPHLICLNNQCSINFDRPSITALSPATPHVTGPYKPTKTCGKNICPRNQYCCNLSCSICTRYGAGCKKMKCNTSNSPAKSPFKAPSSM